jgi:hypothetical protein
MKARAHWFEPADAGAAPAAASEAH